MDESRYKEILNSFDGLVSYATTISHELTGIETNDDRLLYATVIFSKLVCHAHSLRKIAPNLEPNQTELWDISSTSAIARCLIETYEALSYISINDVTVDVRDFRIKLWKLHDQQRRLKMLNQIGSQNPEVTNLQRDVDLLLKEVTNHQLFLSCTNEIKQKINKGDAPAFYLSQKQRNIDGGINHEYHDTVTMHLSQYIHTYPMSVHQLMNFQAGEPESLRLCSLPIQYSMAFLALAIEGMFGIFPNKLSSASSVVASEIETWSAIAKNGVSLSS